MTGWDEDARSDILDAWDDDIATLTATYVTVDGFEIEDIKFLVKSSRIDLPIGEVVVADRLIVAVPASLLDIGDDTLSVPITPTPYSDGSGGDMVVISPLDPDEREEWTVVEADYNRRLDLWTLTLERNIRVG